MGISVLSGSGAMEFYKGLVLAKTSSPIERPPHGGIPTCTCLLLGKHLCIAGLTSSVLILWIPRVWCAIFCHLTFPIPNLLSLSSRVPWCHLHNRREASVVHWIGWSFFFAFQYHRFRKILFLFHQISMLKLQILLKSPSPFDIISTLLSTLISLFVCLFWCLSRLALDTSLFKKITLVYMGHHIKTQDEHPLPQMLGPTNVSQFQILVLLHRLYLLSTFQSNKISHISGSGSFGIWIA